MQMEMRRREKLIFFIFFCVIKVRVVEATTLPKILGNTVAFP